MTEQEINTAVARYEYMRLLQAGLAEWHVYSETEKAKIENINKSINKYLEYLGKILTKALEKKG